MKERIFQIPYNKRLHALNLISDLITILPISKEDYKFAKMLCTKYRLLSNDALILAIAIRNGINKLATFDSDFEKAKDLIEILDENYFK